MTITHPTTRAFSLAVPSRKPKRTAFKIVMRCTLTGADWHLVRWLIDVADARDVAEHSLRFDPKFHRNHSRLVEAREATDAEIAAHRAAL